ncbi:hypothetical protein [Hyphomicrobium zavarzinii]|nr:hypothetical protein [Hyphomicrobium zavarzinii]
MKTALTILAAIVMPGGLIVLAVGITTFLVARHRARAKAAQLASAV